MLIENWNTKIEYQDLLNRPLINYKKIEAKRLKNKLKRKNKK